MQLHNRTDHSTFSAVIQALIRPFKPHLVVPKRRFQAGSSRLKYDRKMRGAVTVAGRQQEDTWLYDMAAHSNNDDDKSNDKNNNRPRKRLRM